MTSLKTGSEATQEAALDALFLLRQAWSACPAEVSRAQSIAAADGIPLLQYLIQSGPPRFQEKSEFLLQCLPGTLVVIIKRGNNMRQSVGNPSVYCKLTLGNTPPRQTKVLPIFKYLFISCTGPFLIDTWDWDPSFAVDHVKKLWINALIPWKASDKRIKLRTELCFHFFIRHINRYGMRIVTKSYPWQLQGII